MAERIFVVGRSAVTCLGGDLDATWAALIAGRSGLARHPDLTAGPYLVDVAGRVGPLGPEHDPAPSSCASRLDARFLHLGLAAARQAAADAGWDALDAPARGRTAIVVGSAFGGLDLLEAERAAAATRRNRATSPYLIPGLIINQAAGLIAQELGLHGPSLAPANACASGGHAVAVGALLLRAGEADLALCGASESAFTPEVVNGFATMRALAGRRPGGDGASADAPERSSRPFSLDRAGFIMAEGAGMLALATGRAVSEYGLRPRAELIGWASTSDGHHMTAPEPVQVARCLELALDHAGLRPDQVDYYNAHGTATPTNDRVETRAIEAVFGPSAARLPVSSIKGALGHALGAASAIEAAVCVRALAEGVIPPTLHHTPDPELTLDYVPGHARRVELEVVMSAAFGFGGTNNVLVFRRVGDA